MLLFAGTIQAARAWGVWRNRISDQEYAARVSEIDHPRYDHLRGQAPVEAERGPRKPDDDALLRQGARAAP